MPDQKRTRALTLGVAALSLITTTVAACGSSTQHSSSSTAAESGAPATGGPTKSTITIGYINDITGPGASTVADGTAAAQARVDMQNADGGVNGHPLKLVVSD